MKAEPDLPLLLLPSHYFSFSSLIHSFASLPRTPPATSHFIASRQLPAPTLPIFVLAPLSSKLLTSPCSFLYPAVTGPVSLGHLALSSSSALAPMPLGTKPGIACGPDLWLYHVGTFSTWVLSFSIKICKRNPVDCLCNYDAILTQRNFISGTIHIYNRT